VSEEQKKEISYLCVVGRERRSFLVRVERQPFFLCACAFLRADLHAPFFQEFISLTSCSQVERKMNTALPFRLNDRVKLPTHHEECDNQHVSGQIGRVITCMKRRGIVWCKVEVTSTVGTFLEVELPASLLTLAESAAAPTTPAAGATPAEPTTMGAQPTPAGRPKS
jgi:hypothetical protein